MAPLSKPKGLYNLRIFITADALLAVIVSWTQIWTQPFSQMWNTWFVNQNNSEVFNLLNDTQSTIGVGLTWTYLIILLALMSLAWIIVKYIKNHTLNQTPSLSIGLFISALILSILEVGATLFSAIYKTFLEIATFPIFTTKIPTFLVITLFALAALIISTCIWGVFMIQKKGFIKYLPWILCFLSVSSITVLTIYTMVTTSLC